MKTDFSKFIEELTRVTNQYYQNRVVYYKVQNNLNKKYNIPGWVSQQIFDKTIPLETMDRRILYLFDKELYSVIKDEDINPERFFTEQEIKEGNEYIYEGLENAEDRYPIIFENVEKIYDDYYVTNMTAQQIHELYNRKVVTYNTKTQRNPRLKEIKNTVVELININQRSVGEIEEEILKGLFIRNTITFNLLKNGEDKLEYDEKTKRLIIYNGELDILDGFHRSLAIIHAVNVNPNVQYITGVNITNFDIEKARRFIVQEDKRNKIDRKYIKAMREDLENIIVRKINESGESDLKGKISSDVNSIRLNIAIVEFNTLVEAIKMNFKCRTQREANNIAMYLIEGFNEIIGMYPDEFIDNYARIKQFSVINHSNMFVGYVTLLAKLQGKSNWKEQLGEILEQIDFSIDNPKWKEIGILNMQLTKRDMSKIKEYFESLVK